MHRPESLLIKLYIHQSRKQYGIKPLTLFFPSILLHSCLRPLVLALGDCFPVRPWSDSPIACLAELRMVWKDRNEQCLLIALRLFFLPENTPAGRNCHGEVSFLPFFCVRVLFLSRSVTNGSISRIFQLKGFSENCLRLLNYFGNGFNLKFSENLLQERLNQSFSVVSQFLEPCFVRPFCAWTQIQVHWKTILGNTLKYFSSMKIKIIQIIWFGYIKIRKKHIHKLYLIFKRFLFITSQTRCIFLNWADNGRWTTPPLSWFVNKQKLTPAATNQRRGSVYDSMSLSSTAAAVSWTITWIALEGEEWFFYFLLTL